MLLWVSFLLGIVCCPASVVWLWFISARPKPWARFTEAENSFWIRRGLPVTWAGACKKAERGPVMKLVVAVLALFSALFAISPFIVVALHRH
jgi:hypothetical protein